MLNNVSLKFFSKLGLTYCVIQLALRCLLFFLSAQDVSWRLLDILRTVSLGFLYDATVLCCLLLPLSLLYYLLEPRLGTNKICRLLLNAASCCFFTFVFFTSICEYYFWQEFHTRFNFIAVDYLVYTHEVINNILQSYPVYPLLAVMLLFSFLFSYWFTRRASYPLLCSSWLKRGCSLAKHFALTAFLLVFMNNSFTRFVANNNYNQEIAANGIFQLFHAFFSNELDYKQFYITKDDPFILSQLQAKLALDQSKLKGSNDSSRFISNKEKIKQPNIVIIVAESLSASFTGLTDKAHSFTPYLDTLAKEAYSYTKVYATGTRTVRGLEAVSLSLPPTPGQSIVRRPDCLNTFNIGTPLQQAGYRTEFVYGGYGYFDNMNEFFAGNGYDILDRTSIPKDEVYFETVWGVADEILFQQALKRLDEFTIKQPLMQIILTTTNHRPYTFPEGKINAPQGKRESVVRYTDYAIHKFIEAAKQRPWFENTVFVILADHNASVAGKTSLPINRYHIPCLVYAPKLIAPGSCNRLMSQIDVIPTVFGMLGMSYESKNLGYDINKLPLGKERAFISTYQQLGYIAEDKLIILEPNRKLSAYKIENYATSGYTPISPPQGLVDDAITWYQGASYLYKHKLLKTEAEQ